MSNSVDSISDTGLRMVFFGYLILPVKGPLPFCVNKRFPLVELAIQNPLAFFRFPPYFAAQNVSHSYSAQPLQFPSASLTFIYSSPEQ